MTPIDNPLSWTKPLLEPKFHGQEHTIAGRSVAPQQPIEHFDVRLELPQTMCAGSKVPMFIGVKHKTSKRTAPAMPPIHLKSILITLEICTRVRVPAGLLGLGQGPFEIWSESTFLADSDSLDGPLCGGTNLHEILKDFSISENLTPTFKTYNIARTYVLHINIEVECAPKHSYLQMVRRICLLPAACRSATTPARRPPQYQTIQSPIDEASPPYEEV